MPNLTWLYVGALYAFSIWVARRVVDFGWRVAALFYLLTLLFFFRPMTGPFVNLATDTLGLLPPWSATSNVNKFTVSNPQMHDPVMQMTPWADQVRKSWRSGQLPLWQDLTACGNPLLGNGQSAAFSPLRILALPLPLGYSMTAEAAMKVLLAMTFTYLFCRRRAFGEIASVIAAVSFGFSLFIIVWLHFSHTIVAPFLPLVFYSVDLLADGVTPGRFAFAALGWAATIFGGHIETVAHIAFLAIIYVLWLVIVEKRGLRFLWTIIGAAATAAVIASPFLVTIAEAIPRSKRFYDLHNEPYGLLPYSDFNSLFVCLQPRFFGWSPLEPYWSTQGHAESMSGFAGILAAVGCFAILIRAAIERRWREREVFFAILWIAVVGMLANIPPLKQLVTLVIPFTAHARLRILLCFLGAVLAGAVVDRVRDKRVIFASVAIVIAVIVFQFVRMDFPEPAALHGSMRTTIPALVVLAFTVALAFPRARRVALPFLLVAVIVDVWLPGYYWNPVMPAASLYPRTPLIDRLQSLTKSGERIVGIDGILFPGTNVIYDFADIRQHDPVANASYVNLLTSLGTYDPLQYYAKWYDAGTHLLDFLNVRWVLTHADVDLADKQRYVEVYRGADGRIYENRDVLPRFFAVERAVVADDAAKILVKLGDWRTLAVVRNDVGPLSQARVDILRSSTTRYDLRVDSKGRALIASSIPFWPGWRVAINGKHATPIVVNSAFTGFVVPPGSSQVRVDYRPMKFWLAAVASLVTSIALLWKSRS